MNVVIARDPAVEFARWLYEDACIAMERKREAALAVAGWKRTAGMRARSSHRRWTPDEDAIVLRMSVKDAARALERTKQSVNTRRWRLNTQPPDC
jgi:hypothetical protein